jgi:ABC-2 type transport system permease protein
MNWRGGRAIIRKTWLSWLQHRGFFFLLAFMWMIPPLIYLFVWMTAAGGGAIGGFTRGSFVAYYLVLIIVNQLTYSQTNWTVGDQIRAGTMNIHLLRPISPIFDVLASECAGKVVYMAFIVPITVILGLVLKPDINFTSITFMKFILALGMAWALRFFWGYWIALLAFWATRANALLAVQDSLMFVLAGQVAPTTLLPGVMEKAAVILPFRYMIGFPVEILTGDLSGSEIQFGFLIQAGWLAFTFLLFLEVWRTGVKQYSAVGG